VSAPAAPPLWTPAQQSWLQAMGYTVFVDGSVDAEPEPSRAEPGRAEASRAEPGSTGEGFSFVEPGSARLNEAGARQDPTPRHHTDTPPPRRNAPAADVPAVPVPARTGTRRPAVRMPPPLQIALLRASGCNPNDPETQALMASWNLDELRGNAAAKRALWPQLRALRRRGRA